MSKFLISKSSLTLISLPFFTRHQFSRISYHMDVPKTHETEKMEHNIVEWVIQIWIQILFISNTNWPKFNLIFQRISFLIPELVWEANNRNWHRAECQNEFIVEYSFLFPFNPSPVTWLWESTHLSQFWMLLWVSILYLARNKLMDYFMQLF